MLFLRLCLVISVVIGWSALASAASVQKDFVVLDANEIPTSEELSPLIRDLNLGFTSRAAWIRLIDNDTSADQQNRRISVAPIYLDSVDIYEEIDGELVRIFQGGDSRPVEVYDSSHFYSAPIGSGKEGPRTFWVRLSSKNLLHASVNIIPSQEARELDALVSAMLSLSIGIVLAYIFWAIFSLSISVDRLIVVFLLQTLLYLTALMIHTGVIRGLLSVEGVLPAQDVLHNMSALVSVLASQIFEYLFLKDARVNRRLLKISALIIGFSLLKFPIFALGEVSLALQVNNACLTVFVLIGLMASFTTEPDNAERSDYRRYLFLYFLPVCLPIAVLMFLTAQGEPPGVHALVYWFYLYTIIPRGIVVWLLAARQRQQIFQADQLRLRAAEAELAAALESEKRQETSNLLSMLLHEVKTPLASLELALDRENLNNHGIAKRSIDSINNVMRQVDRFDEFNSGQITVTIQCIDVANLLREMIDRVEDIFMDDVGESFLVKADEACLRIVIENILHNASKYRAPRTPIQVVLSKDSTTVSIVILNVPGKAGYPDESQVFSKYYRSPGAHSQSGTGLGLYLCSVLANKLDGELIYRKEGARVLFELRLPLWVTISENKTV